VSPDDYRRLRHTRVKRLRHTRIKEILYQVSVLERCAWEDFLTAACAGDQAMRDEVDSLLIYLDEQPAEAPLGGPPSPSS